MNKYCFSLKISLLTVIFLSQLSNRSALAGTLIFNKKEQAPSFSIITNLTESNQIYNDNFLVDSTGLEQLARDIYNQDLIKTSVTSPINFKSASHISAESKLFNSLANTLKETKLSGSSEPLTTSKILSILTQVNDSNVDQNVNQHIYDALNSYIGNSEQELKDKKFNSFKDVAIDLFKKDSTIRSILNDQNKYLSNINLDSISNNNFDLNSAISQYKSTKQNNQNKRFNKVAVAAIPKYSHLPLNSVNTKQQEQLIPLVRTEIKTYQPATYQRTNLDGLLKTQEQEQLETQREMQEKQLEKVRVQIDKQRQKREQRKQQEEKILKQKKEKQLAELEQTQQKRQQQIQGSLAN